MVYVWLILGGIIVLAGGEMLVRYSSDLAISAGVSPLVVGLTVVAFGTSAPEMITSVYGRWIGEGSLAFGNVVGSNIFNALLILGISAVVAPLAVASELLRRDVPLLTVISLATTAFAWSGIVSKLEALVLLSVLVIHTTWLLVRSRAEAVEVLEEFEDAHGRERTRHWAIWGDC